MQKVKKILIGLFVGLGFHVACFAENAGITSMQTEAEGLITDALAAVTAIVVAGFAITGIMWAARKVRGGIRSS